MDIDSMVDIIQSDLNRQGSYDRYPIRFLSMKLSNGTSNYLMELRTKVEALVKKCVEIVDFQNFLLHDDGWVTIDRFRKKVYALDSDKSYIIVGFSEYARFLSNAEFITLLLSLLELENNGNCIKRRIYIPCFAIYSQVRKIVKANNRRMDVYNPFLNEMDIEDLPRIFFIDDNLDNSAYKNEVNNSSEWFGLWRKSNVDITKPIICISKTLSLFYEKASPDNVYNIKKISTYEELLLYLYGIKDIVPYKDGADEYFRRLMMLLRSSHGTQLKSIILRAVNAQEITVDNIYSLWKVAEIFERWLIQNYVILFNNKESYLTYMMSSMIQLSVEEFVEKAYVCIFENLDDTIYEERKRLILSIKRIEHDIRCTRQIEKYFEKLLCELINRQAAVVVESINITKESEFSVENIEKLSLEVKKRLLPILTDCSSYERQLIIWLFRSGLLEEVELNKVYSNLREYLSKSEINASEGDYSARFAAYFDLYRRCKLGKICGNLYNDSLLEWNKNEDSFYEWYTSGQIQYPESTLKKQNFIGPVYVLDGVGAEYLDYLLALLEDECYDVEFCNYAKSHLPSVTSIAKEFYDLKYHWVTDFDINVIHGEIYNNTANLERALSVIKRIIKQIIYEHKDESFAIIADHGSSVGHKLFKREKKYNYDQSDHDGRCYLVKGNQSISSSVDYVLYTDERSRQWVISLNQQSLYNTSKYEVHGGATPEEIIVPVIIAHKSNKKSRTYKVNPKDLKVSGIKKELEFKISPKPENAQLLAKDGTNVNMVYDHEKKIWIGKLKRGIEQTIEVCIENQHFCFKTIPPTKMGDDLFDD